MQKDSDEILESAPPLGAVSRAGAELGPISPELALVDPELAERARQLLPDPGERLTPRPRRAAPPVAPEAKPATVAVEPSPRKRRWKRTVVLAGLVFAVGAASGGLLGEEHASSPGALEVQSAAPTSPEPSPSQPQPTTSGKTSPLRPPKLETKQRVAPARITWAANVLGVAANVDRPGVTLVWQRPSDSDHVVVVRTPATSKHGEVVYRGSAATFRDAAPLPCTAYRYTIVNYDRKGHRATGVPTSVVTQGCA